MPNKKKIKELYARAKQLGIDVSSPEELERDMEDKAIVKDGKTTYVPNDNAYEFYQTLSERDDVIKKQGFDKWYDENLKKKDEPEPNPKPSSPGASKSSESSQPNLEIGYKNATDVPAQPKTDKQFVEETAKKLGVGPSREEIYNKSYENIAKRFEQDLTELKKTNAYKTVSLGNNPIEIYKGAVKHYQDEVAAKRIDPATAQKEIEALYADLQKYAELAERVDLNKSKLEVLEGAIDRLNPKPGMVSEAIIGFSLPLMEAVTRLYPESQRQAAVVSNLASGRSWDDAVLAADMQVNKDLVGGYMTEKANKIAEATKKFQEVVNYNNQKLPEGWQKDIREATSSFIASTGYSVPVMAAAITGDPALIGTSNYALFNATAGNRWNEIKDDPNKTTKGKYLDAIGTGAFEVLFEQLGAIPVAGLYKQVGKTLSKEAYVDLLKEANKTTVRKFLEANGAALSFTGEGAEEIWTGISQRAVDYLTMKEKPKNPDGSEVSFNDFVYNKDQMKKEFMGGLVGGIVYTSPAAAISAASMIKDVTKRERVKKLEGDIDALKTDIANAPDEVKQPLEEKVAAIRTEIVNAGNEDFDEWEQFPKEVRSKADFLSNQIDNLKSQDTEGMSEQGKAAIEQKIKELTSQIDELKKPIEQEGIGEELQFTSLEKPLQDELKDLGYTEDAVFKNKDEVFSILENEVKPAESKTTPIRKSETVLSGKDISARTVEMGSDQGGISDFTANRIASEDYKKELVSIEDLRKSDPDLEEYLNSNTEIRDFEGEPHQMEPIVSSKGEVIDGYNRIAQFIADGEKEITVLKGISKDTSLQPKNEPVYGLLNKEQVADLEKEIEDSYLTSASPDMFGSHKNRDIRMNLYNYEHPLASKTVNGVDLRIAHGFVRDSKQTYLLYADGKVVGQFKSAQDAKDTVKLIEDNLVKELPESLKAIGENKTSQRDYHYTELSEAKKEKQFHHIGHEGNFVHLSVSTSMLTGDVKEGGIVQVEGKGPEYVLTNKDDVKNGVSMLIKLDGNRNLVRLDKSEKSVDEETADEDTKDEPQTEESVLAKISELEKERKAAPVRAKRGEKSKKTITSQIKNYKEQLREIQGKPARKIDSSTPLAKQLKKFSKDVDTNNLSHEERIILDVMGRVDAEDKDIVGIPDTGRLKRAGVIIRNGAALDEIVNDYINEHELDGSMSSDLRNSVINFLTTTQKPSDWFNKIRERESIDEEAQVIEDEFFNEMTEMEAEAILAAIDAKYGDDALLLAADLDTELEQFVPFVDGTTPLSEIFNNLVPATTIDVFTENAKKYIDEKSRQQNTPNSQGKTEGETGPEGITQESETEKRSRELKEKGISESASKGFGLLDDLFDESFIKEPTVEYSPIPKSVNNTIIEDEDGIFINETPSDDETRGIILYANSKGAGQVSFSVHDTDILNQFRKYEHSISPVISGDTATIPITTSMVEIAKDQSIVMEPGVDLFGHPVDRKIVDSKSIFAQNYNAQIEEAERDWKKAKAELTAKKNELAKRAASVNDRNRILTPLVMAERTRANELTAIINKRDQVEKAERAQQSLFENKEDYDAVRRLLPGVPATQISLFVDQAEPKELLSPKKKAKDRKFPTPESARVIVQKTEAKQFNLTGTDKIKSPEDVAAIMQFLESESQENFFAVHIKKSGDYEVQYLSTGSVNATITEATKILLGARDFGAIHTVLVHNHPSGNLNPSNQDVTLTKAIAKIADTAKLEISHIIMDEKTGAYLLMDKEGESTTQSEYSKLNPNKKLKVVKYSSMVSFAPIGEKVTDSLTAAKVVHQMRFGIDDKYGVFVLSNQGTIQATYLMGNTTAAELAILAGRHVGTKLIISTNGEQNVATMRTLLKNANVDVIDVIVYNSNEQNYTSTGAETTYNLEDLGVVNEPNLSPSQTILQLENQFGLLKTEIKNGESVLRAKMYPNTAANTDKLYAKATGISKKLSEAGYGNLQGKVVSVVNTEGSKREAMLTVKIVPKNEVTKFYNETPYLPSSVSEPGLEDLYKASKAVNAFADNGILGFDEMINLIIKRYGSINENFFGVMKGAYNLAQTINPREGMTPPGEVMTKTYNQFITDKSTEDVFNTQPNLESTGSGAAVENAVVQNNVPAADTGIVEQSTGNENQRNGAEGNPGGSSTGIRNSVPVDSGTGSDKPISGGQSGDLRSLIDSGNDRGSDTDSPKRIDATDVRTPSESIAERSDKQSEFDNKLKQQAQSEDIPAIVGDLQNISDTLPFLMNGQIEDVAQAENKLVVEGNKGILFANGTGTGKGLMSLGIAKRFIKQGKREILFVVPDQKLVTKMVREGKMLQIAVNPLESVKDAGTGVSVTTYANFRENENLRKRNFDLIVFDEAHNILENQQGEIGTTTQAMRAIVGIGYDAEIVEREKVVGPQPQSQEFYNEYQSEVDGNIAWTAYHNKVEANKELIKSNVQSRFDNTKVVLLSATPFAHEKTLIYGDQILYDMGNDKNQFYIQNFGYRMRYNKLTTPDSEVDVSLMQRTFTDNQIKKGLHNIRMLDVPFDYSRDFLLLDSEVGDDIDEGVRILTDEFKLGELVRRAHGGNYSSKLLEGIKARLILPVIQKHIDAGHKIVVFHSYNAATPAHPFGSILDEAIKPNEDHGAFYKDKLAEFRRKYPKYEALDLRGLMNPIETFKTAPFKDKVLFINGLQSKGKNLDAMDTFNDDNSDKSVIVVNMAAGASGISLHDETGKNQRLLVNLGLPVRPVFAIQTEGRIYRTGQASNAMFVYPVINTDFEKRNFSKIGERADSTESLALGSIGRNLKDVFIQGYLNPIDETLYEGQGTGGKVNDKSTFNIDNFEFAKTLYFGQQKKNARTKAQEGNDYYATPEPVGLMMVEMADMRSGERALEPSAGHGAIARWFPEDNSVHFVEPSSTLNAKLTLNATQPNKRIHNTSFEDLNEVNKFNTIVMNPPFGTSGKLAMDHVKKAFEGHLKDGGRLVALIPDGPAMDKRFADWYASGDAQSAVLRKEVLLPGVTFERAGTQVRTRILVIDKITDPELRKEIEQPYRSDLSNIDSTKELFDRLKETYIPSRLDVEPTVEDQKVIAQQYEPNANGTHATQSKRTDKNGRDVHVVKFVKTMDYDFFLKVKNYVNANDGWYSKFGKQFETFDQFKANDYVNEINRLAAEQGVNEPGTTYYHQAKANEAKEEYFDQLRRSRSDLTMNGMNMFNAVPAAIKWAYHSMASGIKTLNTFLSANGLSASLYWNQIWSWAKGLNQRTKSAHGLSGFNMLNVRSHRAFKVQLRQIFDGTKHKAEIDLNLSAAITAMEGLVNSSSVAKQRYEPILKGLQYLEDKIQGLTHPEAYQYYRQMENDSLPTPIVYDYEETGFRAMLQHLQWTMAPVRKLQQDMKKAGAAISDRIDAEMHIELFNAKAKGKLREFMNKVVKSSYKGNPSLIERMAEDGVDIVNYGEFLTGNDKTPSFGDYMHALHAPERNAYVAAERQKLWDDLMAESLQEFINASSPVAKELAQMKIDALNSNANPNAVLMPDGGSGMTNDEAAQIINALDAQGLTPTYQKYADEFRNEVLKPMQELMLDGGLANDKIVDDWNDRYKNYVPLWVEDYVEEKGGLGGHSGLAGHRDAQPIKGSMKGRVNPMLASIEKYRRTVKQAEENKAVQSFASLIRTYPNEREYRIEYPQIEMVMDGNGQLVAKYKADQVVPRNAVKFYEDGKMRYVVFTRRGQLYDAFNSFGKGTPDSAFYRALNLFNTWMYSVALKFNPDFALLSNPIRDIETAMLNIGSEVEVSGVRTKIAKNFFPAISAMYKIERGHDVHDAMTQYADEFIKHGGMTSWGELVAGRTTADKLESLQKIMAKVDGLSDEFWNNPAVHSKEAIANFFGALGDVTTAIENATRLATYIAARESGVSEDKSAQIAKNITVNFEKKGTVTPYVAPIYWLANAGVQGSSRMLSGLVKSRKVQLAAAMVMAGAYGLAVYNLSRCPEGYSTLDEGIKSRYLVIYKNCNEKYYTKIPFAYGWNAIKYYGDAAAMLHLGHKSVSETITNGLVNTLNAFNPLGYADSPKDLIENVIPSSMQLIYDLNNNETWYGKPIHPENDDKRYGIVKDSKNYWRYPGATENWAIELADELSQMSGATSDIDAGSIEVSPNTLQYAKDQLGGGALRTISDAMGIAGDVNTGNIMEREMTKYPLVRVFVGKERANSTNKKLSEMLVNSFTEKQTPVQIQQYFYLVGQKVMAIGEIQDPEVANDAIRSLRADVRLYVKNVGYEKLSELGLGDRTEIHELMK